MFMSGTLPARLRNETDEPMLVNLSGAGAWLRAPLATVHGSANRAQKKKVGTGELRLKDGAGPQESSLVLKL